MQLVAQGEGLGEVVHDGVGQGLGLGCGLGLVLSYVHTIVLILIEILSLATPTTQKITSNTNNHTLIQAPCPATPKFIARLAFLTATNLHKNNKAITAQTAIPIQQSVRRYCPHCLTSQIGQQRQLTLSVVGHWQQLQVLQHWVEEQLQYSQLRQPQYQQVFIYDSKMDMVVMAAIITKNRNMKMQVFLGCGTMGKGWAAKGWPGTGWGWAGAQGWTGRKPWLRGCVGWKPWLGGWQAGLAGQTGLAWGRYWLYVLVLIAGYIRLALPCCCCPQETSPTPFPQGLVPPAPRPSPTARQHVGHSLSPAAQVLQATWFCTQTMVAAREKQSYSLPHLGQVCYMGLGNII